MTKGYPLVFIIILIAEVCWCQQRSDLQRLVQLAIDKDYGLSNRGLDIEHTALERTHLRESFLPRVDIDGNYAFLFSSLKLEGNPIEIPPFGISLLTEENRYSGSAQLLQSGVSAKILIYSGGRISNLSSALREKEAGQSYLLERERQLIIADVVATYDQLALLDQVNTVLNESTIRLALNRRTAEKAFQSGLITKYDYQKIAVAQAQLDSKLTEYNGKRELIIQQLHLLTGESEETLSMIRDTLQIVSIEFEQNGIENRADLRALENYISAAEHKIAAAQKWIVPKVFAGSSVSYVGVFGGTFRSQEPILPGGDALRYEIPDVHVLPMLRIGAAFIWHVFDGNAGKRETQLAKIEKERLENEKGKALDKLALNLAKCKTDLHINNKQVELRRTLQRISWNALSQATKEYNAGLIKSLQLVEAETDYRSATLDYVDAIYKQRRAAFELLLATGDLNIDRLHE